MYHAAAKQLVEQLDYCGLLQRSGYIYNRLYSIYLSVWKLRGKTSLCLVMYDSCAL